jgi:hypothetical protein
MNDLDVDPRRLELLLELCRLGSMREVGESMNVTTSTVSQQIAALAREAGTPLIEPDGRRVRLTPATPSPSWPPSRPPAWTWTRRRRRPGPCG